MNKSIQVTNPYPEEKSIPGQPVTPSHTLLEPQPCRHQNLMLAKLQNIQQSGREREGTEIISSKASTQIPENKHPNRQMEVARSFQLSEVMSNASFF